VTNSIASFFLESLATYFRGVFDRKIFEHRISNIRKKCDIRYLISNRISDRVIIWPDTGYFSNIRDDVSILFKKKKKRKQEKNSDNNFFISFISSKCDKLHL